MFFGNLAPGGYAWIIPKAGCANVGLGTWERFRGNLRELFDKFIAARRLEPGKATGGFVPVLGPPPRTVKDNVMLVGDAAGMVMATNGGGNNVAMIAGRFAGLTAADHLLDGTPLDAYETRWRTAVGGPLAQGAPAKTPAPRPPRGGDVHHPPPPRPPGDAPGAPPPARRGRCPASADRRCRGPPPGGLPEDRGRGRLRRPVRRRRPANCAPEISDNRLRGQRRHRGPRGHGPSRGPHPRGHDVRSERDRDHLVHRGPAYADDGPRVGGPSRPL